MPILRIGYGLFAISIIAAAAMAAVSIGANVGNAAAILTFAATTIAGVLALLTKLEKVEEKMLETNRVTVQTADQLQLHTEAVAAVVKKSADETTKRIANVEEIVNGKTQALVDEIAALKAIIATGSNP